MSNNTQQTSNRINNAAAEPPVTPVNKTLEQRRAELVSLLRRDPVDDIPADVRAIIDGLDGQCVTVGD